MASASSAPGMQNPLDVRAILGTSLSVWPRLMLAFGPIYALQVLPDVLQRQMAAPKDFSGPGLLTMFAADLIGLLISIVCLGALTAVATQVLDGAQPRLLPAVDTGLRRFFPVLGTCTLAGLAIFVGFILLLVPGFIATTWYFLVVPVCVLENPGPRASLRRSTDLSKGGRWQIFALFVVIMLAGGAGAALSSAADRTIGGIGAAVVDVLAATAVGIFAGTIPVVVYRALTGNTRRQAVLF